MLSNDVVSLFVQLSDTSNFTKEIKDRLAKIDMDLKASASYSALNQVSAQIIL